MEPARRNGAYKAMGLNRDMNYNIPHIITVLTLEIKIPN